MKQLPLFQPPEDSRTWKLMLHLTRFANAAFGRVLRPSRSLHDAVVAARESQYTEDEIRLAIWVAACLGGEEWIKQAIKNKTIQLEVLLRHKGGYNQRSGQPAKRWLDDLLSRADETSPALVGHVLRRLPPDMIEEEKALLKRMLVAFEE